MQTIRVYVSAKDVIRARDGEQFYAYGSCDEKGYYEMWVPLDSIVDIINTVLYVQLPKKQVQTTVEEPSVGFGSKELKEAFLKDSPTGMGW